MSNTAVEKLLSQRQSTVDYTNWKPLFFSLSNESESKALEKLLTENPDIVVHDEIENQLSELMKSMHPQVKLKGEALKEAVSAHVGNTPLVEYGKWVFYPWSKKLVHILDEEEYIFVRTSRNMYKITPEERDILATKKIGVVGLSVGQSVSLTLAMERICGEIRLTDFDILELTNLNRIRTGIHNVGLRKVYAVAREIAEIDPYIKVLCFPNGLNEDNMDDYFMEGGKLDLLIEESDGLDIKVRSRYKAKTLGVPVLMEASDRCMVDVERFDLEPERPILHGLVEHLDPEKLKTLKTNEEKIPYMLDILGIDTCSTRLKASMLEIEQTITTWPQLASAVIMGGGITADVSRRILLNQFKSSGRYHVDVEELIGDKKEVDIEKPQPVDPATIGLHEIARKAVDERFEKTATVSPLPKQDDLNAILEAACLAPSGGNAQPWRWYIKDNHLFLLNPFSSDHNILGYGNRANYVAQGAALENLEVKAASLGYAVSIDMLPQNYQDKNVIAKISFTPGANGHPYKDLGQAVGLRLTNRSNEGRVLIDARKLEEIASCAGDYGSSLTLFTEQHELEKLTYVLGEMERIRILEKIGHRDFVSEIRWSDAEAQKKKDGIELGSIDLTISERAGLYVAKDKNVVEYLRNWNLGGAFSKLTRKTVESASAIGVLRMEDWSEASFLKGGRILERIWLKANQMGISFQPTAASVFMRLRYEAEGQGGFSEQTMKQIQKVLPDYYEALKKGDHDRKEIFIFRLSIAEKATQRSIRKPLSDVILK